MPDLTTAMASSCAWRMSLSRVGRDRRSDTRDVEERRGSRRVWVAMLLHEAGRETGVRSCSGNVVLAGLIVVVEKKT